MSFMVNSTKLYGRIIETLHFQKVEAEGILLIILMRLALPQCQDQTKTYEGEDWWLISLINLYKNPQQNINKLNTTMFKKIYTSRPRGIDAKLVQHLKIS
jgi:hypothetical protein